MVDSQTPVLAAAGYMLNITATASEYITTAGA